MLTCVMVTCPAALRCVNHDVPGGQCPLAFLLDAFPRNHTNTTSITSHVLQTCIDLGDRSRPNDWTGRQVRNSQESCQEPTIAGISVADISIHARSDACTSAQKKQGRAPPLRHARPQAAGKPAGRSPGPALPRPIIIRCPGPSSGNEGGSRSTLDGNIMQAGRHGSIQLFQQIWAE